MVNFRSLVFSIASVVITICGCKNHKERTETNTDAHYKHLMFYNLDIKTFQDSDGDGMGDIKGLTSRLQYLKDLGINAIWLSPFQSSPLQDDGYDITNYYDIDPRLGNFKDLTLFMATAKKMGFTVVMDIVLNHTSIKHPWFRAKPQWYVWSKKQPADWDKGMGFPGVENASWDKDSTQQAWYFHRFYRFQPDLNYQDREVVAEAKRIMAFWLNKGFNGFRLDAVPFIIDDPRKSSDKPYFDFSLLHELTGFVKKNYPKAFLLGEANVDPKENEKYFEGKENGLQMMFNFYANQYLFYALATGKTADLKKALMATKQKPGTAQWAWFLRNHDEIDLGRLKKDQLAEVYKAMGPDSSMQLYGRGIRRRLAPMLNNNAAKLKMAYDLLYTLPGTPVIRQGEEIGMGDDLLLKERLAVRTPMQWDTTKNGGFSKGVPFRPVIKSGPYGIPVVNVMAENNAKTSLLSSIKSMIQLRKQYPEMINGDWEILDTPNEVLSIKYSDHGKQIIISHNFGDKPSDIEIMNKRVHLGAYGSDWRRL